MTLLRQQTGAAIIVALFITSLVVIATIAMMMRLHIDMRHTELLLRATEMSNDAEGSVAWAIDQLNTDWLKKNPNQVMDQTPIKSAVNTVQNAKISSVIYDAQERFNINNLIEPAWQDDFTTLLSLVDSMLDQAAAQKITLAVVDWLSFNGGGATNDLENYYLKANPPYRAPHRPMASVSELRLVKGITPALYQALAPNIIVLPEVTKININHAPILVLMCLSKTLDITTAKKILAQRNKTPFLSVQAFLASATMKNSGIPEEKLTVASDYFLVKTNVKLPQQKLQLYTLLQRITANEKSNELIIWQSKGTL